MVTQPAGGNDVLGSSWFMFLVSRCKLVELRGNLLKLLDVKLDILVTHAIARIGELRSFVKRTPLLLAVDAPADVERHVVATLERSPAGDYSFV